MARTIYYVRDSYGFRDKNTTQDIPQKAALAVAAGLRAIMDGDEYSTLETALEKMAEEGWEFVTMERTHERKMIAVFKKTIP